MNAELLKEAIEKLLTWYPSHKRELPWRDNPSPYLVWISEIMLQQTRIETVIPYYERFIKELPDVKALAEVEEERLMKLWQGLGYYSRVRNLRLSARIIMSDFNGIVPDNIADLRKLPGIGAYTAGAIASIACGKPDPAVDGNVLRVIMRLFACDHDITRTKTLNEVTQSLREVYPNGAAAGELTEGLMELGEVVCLPNTQPLCDRCPWNGLCLAHAQGREQDFPVHSARSEREIKEITVALIECGNYYVLRKRDKNGLLADMWEFVNIPGTEVEPLVDWLLQKGVRVEALEPLGSTRHVFTHVEWRMKCYRIVTYDRSPIFTWKTARQIHEQCAIPSAFRYLVDRVPYQEKKI